MTTKMKRSATLSVYEAGLLADDAYKDTSNSTVLGTQGWEPFNNSGERCVSSNVISGFFGRAYFNNQKKAVVVAFRGSENPIDNPINSNDWITNVVQWGLGSCTSQLKQALELAVRVKRVCEQRGYRLLGFTGHSLGGALAAMVALETGSYAVTFNPAPIRQVTGSLRDDYIASHVMNFVSGKDFVSRLNPFVGFAIGSGKVAFATARSGAVGFATSVASSLATYGEAIGEAAAALTVESHQLIPGITVNVRSNQGHSMTGLVEFMKGKMEYLIDPWPVR